jgi:hypothetical protein
MIKLFEGVFLYPSPNVIKIRGKPIDYFDHSQLARARLAWVSVGQRFTKAQNSGVSMCSNHSMLCG